MDFDGGIGVDQSELWEWQSQEFDLQKDLLPAPSTSLWADTSHNVADPWSMFDEQTPIKECTDIDLPFCDIGDITIKDFDEGKETLQAKRRRMLQFCPENVEMDFPITDGLSESQQVNLDFSSDEHLLLTDGTEEQLPEEWLVDCSQDSVAGCPPAEMNSSPSASVQANIYALQISLVEEQSSKIEKKKPPQARPTPLKAGRNILRPRKLKAASVAYPFELIKPCGFRGDTTLRDINQRIHAPPPYRIRHKVDEPPASYLPSAISGKPVVHKTKIHTEGGKGSITITRTSG